MKTKNYATATLAVLFLLVATQVAKAGEQTKKPLESCRAAKEEASRIMRHGAKSGDPAAFQQGIELLDKTAQQCWEASASASDPPLAAQLAAESFLCRARWLSFEGKHTEDEREGVIRRELRRGVMIVTNLEHDRSPALLELLEQLAIFEWRDEPAESVRLMEQAFEIALATYGPTDGRYALLLRHLAALYSPAYMDGAFSASGEDAKKAEAYYRQALKVFVENPEARRKYRAMYDATVGGLATLLEGEGRAKEAAEVYETVREFNVELEVEDDLAKPEGQRIIDFPVADPTSDG